MELHQEIHINSPASAAWEVIGQQFGQIGRWAAPIRSSCPVGDQPAGIGSMRACTIADFGPVKAGVIKERIVEFDAKEMRLAYEAVEGLPRFFGQSVNRWSVHAVGESSCVVRIHATVRIHGLAAILEPLFRWQFRIAGARTGRELKHYVEYGEPHPRKARQKQ